MKQQKIIVAVNNFPYASNAYRTYMPYIDGVLAGLLHFITRLLENISTLELVCLYQETPGDSWICPLGTPGSVLVHMYIALLTWVVLLL